MIMTMSSSSRRVVMKMINDNPISTLTKTMRGILSNKNTRLRKTVID